MNRCPPEKISTFSPLPEGKALYFASDFHLGAPNKKLSDQREFRIINWLKCIRKDASAVFFVGDIFDFWYEYRSVIPKGFIRFQHQLLELKDAGVAVIFFTGNHDIWMFRYFQEELGIPVYRRPVSINTGLHQLYVGHGDGLGPGDFFYKMLKILFE